MGNIMRFLLRLLWILPFLLAVIVGIVAVAIIEVMWFQTD